MSTQSTWPPAKPQQPAPSSKDILETPPRRWPKTLIAVVALLLGLGLGNAFFGDEGRMDSNLDRLEALAVRLDRANEEIDRLREGDTLPAALVEVRAERAALASELDQTVLAGAQLFTAGLPESADRAPASSTVRRLLDEHVAATNAGSVRRLMATFTSDGVLTMLAPSLGGWRADYRGTEIAAGLRTLGEQRLRLTDLAQHGDLVWARYGGSPDQGVVVVRVEGRRIAHLWTILLNPPVGID
jgi:hypothetical protein